jgi:hypothetical protein
MIIFEKDRHVKKTEPFFSAHKEYNKWLLEQDFNNKNTTFISTGDLYNSSVPTPEEIDITEKFINDFKGNLIIIAGNHDYSISEKVYSILPLRNYSKVKIITEPCVLNVENYSIAFLPFIKNVKYMKETYENLSDEFINTDYIVYHFDDESVSNKGIDLSYLKGKRIGGHEHLSRKNYELCVPIIGKYDERGNQPTLLKIDNEEQFINVPRFIDYYSIEYGEDLPKVEAKFPIWNIENAPSKNQGEIFYKNAYIHEVHIINKKKYEIKKKNNRTTSQIEFFEEYIKERTDFEDWAITKLKNIIMKK